MKVAFASSDNLHIDKHFGQATTFHLWEIGLSGSIYLGPVEMGSEGEGDEDRIVLKANALQGCAIACSMQIGGPAAAKLVARRIHPMKTQAVVPIAEMITKLETVLQGETPPWLAKTLGLPNKRTLTHELED
jgi:nitrogen fixation protein NifX